MIAHYDKRSFAARGATISVADSYGANCHALAVLNATDLLARLRELRDTGRTTNAEVQRILELPSSRVSEIFAGKRNIKADEAATLVRHFRLDPSAPAKQWAASDPPEPAEAPDTVKIQHIDLSFGLGSTFMEGHVDSDLLEFPRQWVQTITRSPPELLTWTRGRGDSMRPTIDDGDLVLLDRSQRNVREQDALWAFTIGDVGSIKRLRVKGDRYLIYSDNPNVPPDEEPMDFVHIVARVVFVGHRM